jgi:RecB family endonuclease NucS
MGATERWVIVKPDGTILLHTERHGLEAMERPITLAALKRTYSIEHYQDALKQLAALGLPTPEEYAVR